MTGWHKSPYQVFEDGRFKDVWYAEQIDIPPARQAPYHTIDARGVLRPVGAPVFDPAPLCGHPGHQESCRCEDDPAQRAVGSAVVWAWIAGVAWGLLCGWWIWG